MRIRIGPETRKRAGTVLLFALFWAVVFLFFLIATFPSEKAGQVIKRMVYTTLGRQLEVRDIKILPPVRASLHDARLIGKGWEPDVAVDRMTVSVSPFSLLFKPIRLSISARLYQGDLRLRTWLPEPDSDQLDLLVEGSRIDLGEIDLAKEKLPLQIAGILDLSGDLVLQRNNFITSRGKVSVSVRKGRVDLGPALPLPIPPLSFDLLKGEAYLQKGLVTTQNFVIQGGDVDAVLEGRILLENPIPFSRVTALLRFRILSKDIQARMGPYLGLLRKDSEGYYNFPIRGSFAEFNANVRALNQIGRSSGSS